MPLPALRSFMLMRLFRRNKPYPALPRIRTWSDYKRAKVIATANEMRRKMGMPLIPERTK